MNLGYSRVRGRRALIVTAVAFASVAAFVGAAYATEPVFVDVYTGLTYPEATVSGPALVTCNTAYSYDDEAEAYRASSSSTTTRFDYVDLYNGWASDSYAKWEMDILASGDGTLYWFPELNGGGDYNGQPITTDWFIVMNGWSGYTVKDTPTNRAQNEALIIDGSCQRSTSTVYVPQ